MYNECLLSTAHRNIKTDVFWRYSDIAEFLLTSPYVNRFLPKINAKISDSDDINATKTGAETRQN
jgi:hypothetical protein